MEGVGEQLGGVGVSGLITCRHRDMRGEWMRGRLAEVE